MLLFHPHLFQQKKQKLLGLNERKEMLNLSDWEYLYNNGYSFVDFFFIINSFFSFNTFF